MKIQAISTGSTELKTRFCDGAGWGLMRKFNVFRDRHFSEPLPYNCYLIESDEGYVLVDTGERIESHNREEYPALNWAFIRANARIHVTESDQIGPQLRQRGISPQEIKKIIITHLHQDHIGGLKYFPRARCFVSENEFRAASRFDALLNGYMPKTWPSWFKPELIKFENHPFGPFPQSLRFAKDIVLVPTPGHSRGHISVIACPASGADSGLHYFCAGDSVFSQELFYQGHPSGITTDLKQAKKSLKRIREFTRLHPTILLPTHDPDAGRRLKNKQNCKFPEQQARR